MMQSKKIYPFILLIVGFIFFFIYIFLYPRPESADMLCRHMIYVQDNIGVFFTKSYAETGRLRYPIPYYDLLPENITIAFTPRDAAQFDRYIVPKYCLGIFVGIGGIASVNRDLLLIITPLLAVLSVISLYLLTRKIFDEKLALITSLLTFSIPPMLVHGSRFCTIGTFPSTLFLLMGFFYFIKLLEQGDNRCYFLFTFFLICSIFYRYSNIIYVFPFLLYVILFNRNLIRIKRLLISIGIAIFAFAPILILNNELYGSFLITGHQIAAGLAEKTLPSIGLKPYNILAYIFSFLQFKPDFFLVYLERYLIQLIPLLIFGFFMGLLIANLGKPKRNLNYYSFYVFYVFIVTFLYYGGHITYGFEEYTMMAGFVRYLMPVYLLMMPLVIVFFQKITKLNQKVGISLISIFIIICLFNTLILDGGIIGRYEEYQTDTEFHNSVIRNTESNSVIITRYEDKLLFPDRQTVTAAYLGIEPKYYDLRECRFFKLPLDFEVIAYKAAYIADHNIPVYITNELVTKEFKQALPKNGYTMQEVKIKGNNKIYKLAKKV